MRQEGPRKEMHRTVGGAGEHVHRTLPMTSLSLQRSYYRDPFFSAGPGEEELFQLLGDNSYCSCRFPRM